MPATAQLKERFVYRNQVHHEEDEFGRARWDA